MKVVSFNVNGIRARLHQLEELVKTHSPDVIGLQEVKVQDSEFPEAAINDMGYHVEFHGQKGHYGVALMSRIVPKKIQKGFKTDAEDAQRRFIVGCYDISGTDVYVMNGYFPQGESRDHPTKFPAKEQFYKDLNHLINTEYKTVDHYVVMGDFNISPEDKDIGIGEPNAKRWLKTGKCSFLPEEREWLAGIKSYGLSDTFRTLYPDTDDRFSWFDYRSKGFNADPKRGLRIDLILASESLNERCTQVGIDYDIRGMEKPSDHCPIWSVFNLS